MYSVLQFVTLTISVVCFGAVFLVGRNIPRPIGMDEYGHAYTAGRNYAERIVSQSRMSGQMSRNFEHHGRNELGQSAAAEQKELNASHIADLDAGTAESSFPV